MTRSLFTSSAAVADVAPTATVVVQDATVNQAAAVDTTGPAVAVQDLTVENPKLRNVTP
ncbi:MAG TPA: hypothetical protein VNJ54_16800 [Plantibacter sp.]|uniref:hypothetical protein n=1 Tax=Plantibacter sp. TaxID=1871045 RepID=UPI002C330328|nr:hypothetical protein [Plantibacter sp.]